MITGCGFVLELELVTDLCPGCTLSLEAIYNLMKFDWRDASQAIFLEWM